MKFDLALLPVSLREVITAMALNEDLSRNYPLHPGSFPILSATLPMLVFKRGKHIDAYFTLYGEFTQTPEVINQDGGTLIIERPDVVMNNDFVLRGFERVSDIELFAAQSAGFEGAKVFYDAKRKITIFSYNATGRRVYEKMDAFVTSLLPRFCPWLFENAPLTDAERAFLGAIHAGDKTAVSDTLTGFYNSNEFNEWWTDIETSMAIQRFKNNRIAVIRDTAEVLYRQIEEQKQRLNKMLKDARNYELQLSDMKRSGEDFDPIRNVIKDFKNKVKIIAKDGCLAFLVRADLDNIDADETLEAMESCDYSAWSCGTNSRMAEMALAEVLRSNGKYKLQMYSLFEIDGSAYPTTFSSYNGMEGPFVQNRIANPHHYHYHCLGSYEMDFAELASEGNYPELFITMIQSTGSVNEAEGITMERFIQDLACNMNTKCVRDTETGELLTLNDVLKRKEAQQVETD